MAGQYIIARNISGVNHYNKNAFAQTTSGVNYKMKKAYAQATSGADYLIWSAETDIYPGGVSSLNSSYGGIGGQGNFCVDIGASHPDNSNSHIRYIYVDLSQFTTLSINGFGNANGSGAYAGIVLRNSFAHAYSSIRSDTPPSGNIAQRITGNGGGSFRGWWDINVAGLNYGAYVMVQCYNQHGAYPSTCSAGIYQIIGKP